MAVMVVVPDDWGSAAECPLGHQVQWLCQMMSTGGRYFLKLDCDCSRKSWNITCCMPELYCQWHSRRL